MKTNGLLCAVVSSIIAIGCGSRDTVGVLPPEGTKTDRVKYETPRPPVDETLDLGRLERTPNGTPSKIEREMNAAAGKQIKLTGELFSETEQLFGVVIIECFQDSLDPAGKKVRRLTSTVHVVCGFADGKNTFEAQLVAPTERGKHQFAMKGLRMTSTKGVPEEVEIAEGKLLIHD